MTRKPTKPNERSSLAPDLPDDDKRPDFFRRWSARKRRARAGRADGPPAGTTPEPQAEAAGAGAEPAERVLTDEDMPPLESLNENSDYSGFFSPGVSERLRRVALRKLFSSPKLNVVDGLDDYAENYRSFEALGDIVTADMRFEQGREAERAKQALEEETRDAAAETEVAGAEDEAAEKAASSDEPGDAGSGVDDSRVARDDSETPDSDNDATSTEDDVRSG